jgi:hypothetical protein
MAEEEQPVEIQNLLDLSAGERTVVLLGSQGRRFVHHFTPPAAADWLEYERALRPTVIFREDELETRAATRTASDALWQKLIRRVEGYPSPESRVPSPESLSVVPLEHRVKAVAGLDQVQAAEDQDILGDSEAVAVKLEAWWNGQFFPTLVHRFRRPLVEHELRFREAVERRALVTKRIGGQRHPKDQPLESRALPVLPTVIALYDELILSVEGYKVESSELKVQMDVPHKSAAIRALFAQEAVELEDVQPPSPESRVASPEASHASD